MSCFQLGTHLRTDGGCACRFHPECLEPHIVALLRMRDRWCLRCGQPTQPRGIYFSKALRREMPLRWPMFYSGGGLSPFVSAEHADRETARTVYQAVWETVVERYAARAPAFAQKRLSESRDTVVRRRHVIKAQHTRCSHI